MLYLKELIGRGGVRECYRHPFLEDKCVKVVQKKEDLPELLREARVAKLTEPYLKDFTVEYEGELVDTDRGPGLVCGLVRDDDGLPAPTLGAFLEGGNSVSQVEAQLNSFIGRIISCDIFFYDLNLGNFVVKSSISGHKKLFFIDLKSLHKNGYLGFLKMERYIVPLAQIIMFRRIRRLYRSLSLSFPMDELCGRKFFSSFLVKIRLTDCG